MCVFNEKKEEKIKTCVRSFDMGPRNEGIFIIC